MLTLGTASGCPDWYDPDADKIYPPDWGWWQQCNRGCDFYGLRCVHDECLNVFNTAGASGGSCIEQPVGRQSVCGCSCLRSMLEEVIESNDQSPGTIAQQLARLNMVFQLAVGLNDDTADVRVPCWDDNDGRTPDTTWVKRAVVSIRTRATSALKAFHAVDPVTCSVAYAQILENAVDPTVVVYALVGIQLLTSTPSIPKSYFDETTLLKLRIKTEEVALSPKTYTAAVAAQASATLSAVNGKLAEAGEAGAAPKIPLPLQAKKVPTWIKVVGIAAGLVGVGIVAGYVRSKHAKKR